MKPLIITITAVALCLSGFAHASPAKDESVEKLLELTQEKQTYEQMMTQIDALVAASAKQSAEAQGSPLNTDQESAIKEVKAEMRAAMPYSAMHEIGLKVYRESFSEEEIQSLIAFYKSPTGKMFIEKMPIVMAKTMELAQKQIQPAMQKMQQNLQTQLEHMN